MSRSRRPSSRDGAEGPPSCFETAGLVLPGAAVAKATMQEVNCALAMNDWIIRSGAREVTE